MAIEYTKVGPSTQQAFYETLLAFWDRRWDGAFQRDFLDWRYGRRTDGETLVAMEGSKCIGLIDTFIRPYTIGGQEIAVREPCDWYCMPEYRGAGMRLMRFLMAQGEPLLGVGLPETAVAIAPRLNWKHLLDTHDFILPITVRRVAGAVLRKARLGDGSLARYLPRGMRLRSLDTWKRYAEAHGEVMELAPDDWPSAQGSAYAVAPILTKSYVEWLTSGPEALGQVFCLAFKLNGKLAGLSICRIEASKVGQKAKLIHLQASELDVKTLRWMVAENVRRAAELGAESIHCRSSCPTTNAALASLSFYPTANEPVMVGFKDRPIPSGPVNVSFLRGDDAMIPSLIAE